jgi:hypothetical protein
MAKSQIAFTQIAFTRQFPPVTNGMAQLRELPASEWQETSAG